MTDRGVSTVVSYVLVLGIVTLLSSALIGTFGPFVTNQQQATAGSTLEVFGNDLAGDIESADRLVQGSSGTPTIELRTRLPSQVGESPYDITIANQGGDVYEITLQARDFDASAIVTVRTETPVVETTVEGGDLRIIYNNNLVIKNA